MIFAQTEPGGGKTNVAFWVDHWARPPVILFGLDEETFYKNMQVILFPWNDHDEPSNPSALDSNVQWLKDHPNVRFYVNGYASSRGDWLYNLGLSQRRANWVKQALAYQIVIIILKLMHAPPASVMIIPANICQRC